MAQARSNPQKLDLKSFIKLIRKRKWQDIHNAIDRDEITQELLDSEINPVYCFCFHQQWDIIRKLFAKKLLLARYLNDEHLASDIPYAIQLIARHKQAELFWQLTDAGLVYCNSIIAYYDDTDRVIKTFWSPEMQKLSIKFLNEYAEYKDGESIKNVLPQLCGLAYYKDFKPFINPAFDFYFLKLPAKKFIPQFESWLSNILHSSYIENRNHEYTNLLCFYVLQRIKHDSENKNFDSLAELIEQIETEEKTADARNGGGFFGMFVPQPSVWTTISKQANGLVNGVKQYDEAVARRKGKPQP